MYFLFALHLIKIAHTPCMTWDIFNQTLSPWHVFVGTCVLGWLSFFRYHLMSALLWLVIKSARNCQII